MRSFANLFSLIAVMIVLVAGVAGCMDRPLAKAPPVDWNQITVDVLVEANRNMDILVVIDDSGSMGNEQSSLANNFRELIAEIQSIEHGLPNLHIGVVSTDLGIGEHAASGGQCSALGKSGILQNGAPPGETCPVPRDLYISDIEDENGERARNYDGTLTDTFSCIARIGDDGCGYEQPLEAMRRALESDANQGFLRPDARLAVIFVTDEDDCSTRDHAMFDRDRDDLGPANGYRCFEYGVTCDVSDPRAPGDHASCVPRENSPFMYDVSEYVDYLRSLKRHPDRDILVAGIIGASVDPISVGTDGDLPVVLQSCFADENDTEGAFPPVRLRAFLEQFAFNKQTSICNRSLAGALEQIGDFIGPPPEGACMPAKLREGDVQSVCTVSELRDPYTPAQQEVIWEECDNPADPGESSNLPCYTMTPNPEACETEDSLWIKAHYPAGAVVPPDTILRARCEAE